MEVQNQMISIDDFRAVMNDIFRARKHLFDPSLIHLVKLRFDTVAGQPDADARIVAEAIVKSIAPTPLNQKFKDVVYEFVYMCFPDLVANLYTPRVSTQEEILVGAIAGSVAGKAASVEAAPAAGTTQKGRSQHPTLINLAGIDASTLPPRGSLSGTQRLPTMNYIDDPSLAEPGGVADLLDAERQRGERLAAERQAEDERKRVEALADAERAHRGKLDTLDSIVDPVEAAPAGAPTVDAVGDDGFLPDDVVEFSEEEPTQVSATSATAKADLHSRATVAAVDDAVLKQAVDLARRHSSSDKGDEEEDEVPISERVTALPPEPK